MNSVRRSGPPNAQAVTLETGRSDDEVELPGRVVAVHRAATPERDPDAVLLVDGHAVRVPTAGDLGEGSPIGEVTGGGVEVEAVDPTSRRVGVEDGVAGPVPLQPVGDGDVAEGDMDTAIRIQAVQRSGCRGLVVRHRSAVEAALGIAAAVVHPDQRVGEDRWEQLLLGEVGPSRTNRFSVASR